MEGKRIKDWKENQGITDDFEFGIDKNGLTESQRIKADKVRTYAIGEDSNNLVLFKMDAIAGIDFNSFITNVGKRFIDYSHFGTLNQNSALHYRYLLWDIYDGAAELQKEYQFVNFSELISFLTANISQAGGVLSNSVKIKAYYKIRQYDKKLNNLQAGNSAYRFLKSGTVSWANYKDNNIKSLGQTPSGWWSTLVLDVWNDFMTRLGLAIPPTTTGYEVFMSKVRSSFYSAYSTHRKKGNNTKFIFQTNESWGRQVWVPSLNNFVSVNFILQNFLDPIPFYYTSATGYSNRLVSIEESTFPAYLKYSFGNSMYTSNSAYIDKSLVRFYLLKTQYYDGTQYRDAYAMTFKPLGQDIFTTRYYDNAEFQLYGYLVDDVRKPVIRKISTVSATYVGNQAEDIGWQINKAQLIRMMMASQKNFQASGNFNRNSKALKDVRLFVMNEVTGEISPLSDFRIKVETFMRGAMFNLMMKNK